MTPTRWIFSLTLGLSLAACGNKDGEDSATEEADADTDADTDTDTDTDTDPDAEVTLTFQIVGESAGQTLVLAALDLQSSEPALGEVLGSAAVAGGTASLTVPVPSALALLDPEYPLLEGAFFLPYLESAAGEVTGVGMVWPLYLSGEIPAELQVLGLQEGWNALRSSGKYPEVLPLDEIPLEERLTVVEHLTLGGTYAAASPPLASLSLAMVPGFVFEGTLPEALLVDEALTSPWSVTVSGAPPAEHITTDEVGIAAALEVLLAYTDADGVPGLSEGDAAHYAACLADTPVVAMYLPMPTDPLLALSMAVEGIGPGWQAYGITPEDAFIPLSAEEQGMLVVQASCVLN